VSDGTAVDRGDVVILSEHQVDGQKFRIVLQEDLSGKWIAASNRDSAALKAIDEHCKDVLIYLSLDRKLAAQSGQKGGE
jgi:hypothetical protein